MRNKAISGCNASPDDARSTLLDQALIQLQAALREEAVAIGVVFQELIDTVDRLCVHVPPASADTEIEMTGQLVGQHGLQLETRAVTARRIRSKREVVYVQCLLICSQICGLTRQ